MRTAPFVFALASLFTVGCADEGPTEQVTQRGAPPLRNRAGREAAAADGKAPPAAASKRKTAGASSPEEEQEEDAGPKRPPVELDAKSFQRRRDPFQSFLVAQKVELEPDKPRAERKVVLGEYSFEDLKLIAIVNSGRQIVPRALFVGSDGRSKAVRQGEYFSSAEVLLAAVNRDYVEIEIIDEELASSLNMQRGERRAIYLRNE